jgi:hypothetical protein
MALLGKTGWHFFPHIYMSEHPNTSLVVSAAVQPLKVNLPPWFLMGSLSAFGARRRKLKQIQERAGSGSARVKS